MESPDNLDDQFEVVFSDEVDKNPMRSDEDSPLISSGVSSAKSKYSPAVQTKGILNCPRGGCKKTYKTENGLKNHLFVHRMEDVNFSKPSPDEVLLHMVRFVAQVLREMLAEPNCVQEKLCVVNEILKAEDSQEWSELVDTLSQLISNSLAKRTKLLPTNQYQEFQSQILIALNDIKIFSGLKTAVSKLCDSGKELPYIGNIVFRLCIRLGEPVQSFLISRMKQAKNTKEIAVPTLNEQEAAGLKNHLRRFFQNYYSRAISLKNEVWEARSRIIRDRFVIHIEGEPVGSRDVLNDAMWDGKQLGISESAFTFLKGLK